MSMSNEQIERHFESLIAWQARFEENIVKLTDATLSLTRVAQQHDDQIAGLIEAGKETDERLNALILLFERFLGRDKPQ
jgi:hypothetical protein